MYVLLQTPWDESGDPAGRYLPERRGNLHATGGLLIGPGSRRQRATRVAPLAKFEDLSHPETICSHHQMRNPSALLNLQHPGGGNGDSPGRFRPARCGNPNPTGWLLCHGACARKELSLWPTSRSGRTRRGRGLIPYWKVIHISATSTTREQRRRLLGSLPPRRVWKLQPRWLVAVSKRDPAQRGYTSGQLRSPAAPGEDRLSSPDKKCFYVCTITYPRG